MRTPKQRPPKYHARRFPSPRQMRAVELGADELMALLEWELRERPRALRLARGRYTVFCRRLLAQLERRRAA